MKKITIGQLAATLLAVGFTQTALAADLATPYYKAAPAPVSTWTGFYFGGNVGYSWGRETDNWGIFGFPGASETQPVRGVIGGGQWGYNWQRSSWVFGVEGDFQGSGQRDTAVLPIVGPFNFSDTQSLSWFGTDRGRLGWLAAPNVLIYGTGGLAYGRVNSTYALNAGAVPLASLALSSTRAGWAAGAGIEAKLAANWSVKVEYLHLDLGSNNSLFSIGPVPIAGFGQRFTDDIARVGVNYMWSGF
jgi:outer membrane immunogenic protein